MIGLQALFGCSDRAKELQTCEFNSILQDLHFLLRQSVQYVLHLQVKTGATGGKLLLCDLKFKTVANRALS